MAGLQALKPEDVRGKVIIASLPGMPYWEPPAALHPALIILMRASARNRPPGPQLQEKQASAVPVLEVWDPAFRKVLDAAKARPLGATISAHAGPPAVARVPVRNVCGVLRGSDSGLKDTYLLVIGLTMTISASAARAGAITSSMAPTTTLAAQLL